MFLTLAFNHTSDCSVAGPSTTATTDAFNGWPERVTVARRIGTMANESSMSCKSDPGSICCNTAVSLSMTAPLGGGAAPVPPSLTAAAAAAATFYRP
eukprot:4922731-Prymnesium_polylepis.1